MSEDVRHDDTPNLLEHVRLQPRRKIDPSSGFPYIRVWGMPMGCHDRGSLIVISDECDVVKLQNRGIKFPGVGANYENVEDSMTTDDFRVDVQGGMVTMYFRHYYLTASGHSSVTLDRSDVLKEE